MALSPIPGPPVGVRDGAQSRRGRLTGSTCLSRATASSRSTPTVSSELLNLIGHGLIHVKPDIRELAGTQVRFEDGSEERIDVLIMATGYDIKVPFLDSHVFDTTQNEVPLYKLVVHPRYAGLGISFGPGAALGPDNAPGRGTIPVGRGPAGRQVPPPWR